MSDDTMKVKYQWYRDPKATGYSDDNKKYYVSRDKILNDDLYGSIPSDYVLNEEEVRIYKNISEKAFERVY